MNPDSNSIIYATNPVQFAALSNDTLTKEFIEKAIRAGDNEKVIAEYLPQFLSRHPMNIIFLYAALDTSNYELVEHLINLHTPWRSPYGFPLREAVQRSSFEMISQLIQAHPEFICAQDNSNLSLIHYAAECKNAPLVDHLLYLMFSMYNTGFLFPKSFKENGFLLERYCNFCTKLINKIPSIDVDDRHLVTLLFLRFYIRTIIGAQESNFKDVVETLAKASLDVVIREIIAFSQLVLSGSVDQPLFNRHFQGILDAITWLECFENSIEKYHSYMHQLKLIRSEFQDYKPHARL